MWADPATPLYWRAFALPCVLAGALAAWSIIAAHRSEEGDVSAVSPFLFLIPAAALVGLPVAVVVYGSRPNVRRGVLFAAALAGTLLAAVAGLIVWGQAADIACDERYECPF